MRAIIVDDEITSAQVLEDLISNYLPELKVVAVCHKPADAVNQLVALKPDIVFMDIELPGMSGFDILEKVQHIQMEVIFTTAHIQYGIKAIQFSAIDYLLKPIDIKELIQAVGRVRERKSFSNPVEKLKNLFDNVKLLQTNAPLEKIAFPTSDGLVFIHIDDIIRCSSSGNYTFVYRTGKDRLLISKTLKDIEAILPAGNFYRIHNSHVVNLKYVRKFIKGDANLLVMKDDAQLEVSRRKKDELIRLLNP
jgi:two-component system, LytTR family, response regulator